jgi:hypothetical protein
MDHANAEFGRIVRILDVGFLPLNENLSFESGT